jgi:hypothetical protein
VFVTIEVLKGIRDELRGTNARLDTANTRLERVERRQADTEVRLATELAAVVSAVTRGARPAPRRPAASRATASPITSDASKAVETRFGG